MKLQIEPTSPSLLHPRALPGRKRVTIGLHLLLTNHISLHLSHSPVSLITGGRTLLSSSIKDSSLPPVPHHLSPPHRGLCPGLSHQDQCSTPSGICLEHCLHHATDCLGSWRHWDPQDLHSGPFRWPPRLPPFFMLPALTLKSHCDAHSYSARKRKCSFCACGSFPKHGPKPC